MAEVQLVRVAPLPILAEAERTEELARDNAQANANAVSNPQATDRDDQPYSRSVPRSRRGRPGAVQHAAHQRQIERAPGHIDNSASARITFGEFDLRPEEAYDLEPVMFQATV